MKNWSTIVSTEICGWTTMIYCRFESSDIKYWQIKTRSRAHRPGSNRLELSSNLDRTNNQGRREKRWDRRGHVYHVPSQKGVVIEATNESVSAPVEKISCRNRQRQLLCEERARRDNARRARLTPAVLTFSVLSQELQNLNRMTEEGPTSI